MKILKDFKKFYLLKSQLNLIIYKNLSFYIN